jgi:hemerythrin-like domain-containing protein
MREHGVLNRILLIYEEATRKLSNNESFDETIIANSASIIRSFIEQYHERNEENQIFPRFHKAGQMIPLVNVLYQQHQAGRRLTDTILQLTAISKPSSETRQPLIGAMQSFIRMYRPHEAREDTVLFPALRKVVSSNEFESMAEDFEKDERQRFGEDGFQMMVERVANLEKTLGIHDLATFTAT